MFWQYNINLNEEMRSAGYASLWLAVLNSCDWLILILSAFGEFFFNSLVVISIVATLTFVENVPFRKLQTALTSKVTNSWYKKLALYCLEPPWCTAISFLKLISVTVIDKLFIGVKNSRNLSSYCTGINKL